MTKLSLHLNSMIKSKYILGFTHLFLILALALIAVVGIGYYAYKNGQISLTSSQDQVTVYPTQTIGVEESAEWKTYRSAKYRFEIKYPKEWLVKETGDALGNDLILVGFHDESGDSEIVISFPKSIAEGITAIGSQFKQRNVRQEKATVNGLDAILVTVTTLENPEWEATPIFIEQDGTMLQIDGNYEDKTFRQTLSTFRFLDAEKETISQFLGRWDNLQKDIPFKPVLGGAGWFVDYFQFIGNNTFLVSFEDGHVLHAAIHKKQDDQFTLMESFENIPFKSTEWNSLEEKYGDQNYTVTTYGKGGHKNSSEWIKISDNIFIE